jgi:hypothetical protein
MDPGVRIPGGGPSSKPPMSRPAIDTMLPGGEDTSHALTSGSTDGRATLWRSAPGTGPRGFFRRDLAALRQGCRPIGSHSESKESKTSSPQACSWWHVRIRSGVSPSSTGVSWFWRTPNGRAPHRGSNEFDDFRHSIHRRTAGEETKCPRTPPSSLLGARTERDCHRNPGERPHTRRLATPHPVVFIDGSPGRDPTIQ